jgi:integrase
MRRERKPRMFKSRFSPTPLGFLRWRWRSGDRLARSSWIKWRGVILLAEELRGELFDDRPWRDIDPEDIAFELMQAVYARCRARDGGKPSTNSLRGRYDALSAYFEFLRITGELEEHPLDHLKRPSSKAKDQPFLEPTEDEALARVEKHGHEVAVYALARGQNLREFG